MSSTTIQDRIKEIKEAYNELEKEYTKDNLEMLKVATLVVIADKIDDISFEVSKLGR